MENTIRNRLLQYLDALKLSISAFEKSRGFSNGSISKFLRGDQQTIGVDKIEHILNLDENLNADWLMRGKGEMTYKKTYEMPKSLNSVAEPTEFIQSSGRVKRGEVTQLFGDFAEKLEDVIDRINQRVDNIDKKD